MITQREQIDRLIDQYSKTMGTDAAKVAAEKDPFVAYEGLKSSLENLSAATIKMPAVVSGLNWLGDTINGLADKIKDSPAAGNAALAGGTVAAGGGAYLAGKTAWNGLGWLAGGTGRAVAGAARMSPMTILAAGLAAGIIKAVRDTSSQVAADNLRPAARFYDQGSDANRANTYKQYHGVAFEGGMHRAGRGAGPAPGIAQAVQESADAGRQIQDNLNVTASPKVDNSGLQQTLSLGNQILAVLRQIGPLAAQAGASAEAAIRQAHTDYGVAP